MIQNWQSTDRLAHLLYSMPANQNTVAEDITEASDEEDYKKRFAGSVLEMKLSGAKSLGIEFSTTNHDAYIADKEQLSSYIISQEGRLFAVRLFHESMVPGNHKAPLTQFLRSYFARLKKSELDFYGGMFAMSFMINNSTARKIVERATHEIGLPISLIDLTMDPNSLRTRYEQFKQKHG